MAENRTPIARSPMPKPVPASSLDYRPRDYFGRYDRQTELLTTVKGVVRRQAIRQALEEGDLERLPDIVKQSSLAGDDRQRLGAIHPDFMGGEYLPRSRHQEIEIARIRIRSTTSDVTCLYARPVGRRIAYRVVDEYEGETLGEPRTRTSVRPLTMGQMIDFFLGAWDLYDCLQWNFGDDNDIEGMLRFFKGESEFYPCFDETLRERVQARFPAAAEEDEDDDEVGGEGDVETAPAPAPGHDHKSNERTETD